MNRLTIADRRFIAWARYERLKIGGTPIEFARAWFWVMGWDALHHKIAMIEAAATLTEKERELDRR